MPIIFKAKTNEGFNFKILGEVLHNTLKTISINITQNGIYSTMIDAHKKILIDIQLSSLNFTTYSLLGDDLLFGIQVGHFYKIISSLKKKDSLTLQIDSETPKELQVIVTPREKDHIEVSRISIQNIQSLDIEVPSKYKHPVHVSSSKFQKMCKDMLNIGKEVHVYGNKYFAVFECETPGIYKKELHFGEELENSEVDKYPIIHYNFEVEQLVRISKISSLSPLLYIFLDENLPLLLKAQVGSLGSISIFLKSNLSSNNQTCIPTSSSLCIEQNE